MKLADQPSEITFLIHDRDIKIMTSFDAALTAKDTRTLKSPVHAPRKPQRPRANAICERYIGTFRHECVHRTLVLGRRRLDTVPAEYVERYNAHHHRSLSQRPPAAADSVPALIGDVNLTRLQRSSQLGGLIHYYRVVARTLPDGVPGTST